MATDYWNGGWAAPKMEDLPGRKAAATANANYGPLNALADIIGAVVQRNAQRGAMKEVESFGGEVDSALNPQYEAPVMGQPIGKTGDAAQTEALQMAQPELPAKKLSYREYADKVKGMRAQLANRMLRKYGTTGMNMALSAIDDTVNQKINDYGQGLLGDAYAGLFDGVDIGTMGGQMEAWKRFGNYQNLARQMGQEVMSPQEFQSILNTQALKQSTMNLGNRVQVVESPASGAAFDDGRTFRPAGAFATGMTPGEQANMQYRMTALQQDQRNKDRMYGLEVAKFNYRVQEAERQLKALEAGEKANGGENAAGFSKTQMDALKEVLNAFNKWNEANPGDTANNPYASKADAAIQILSRAGGIKDNGSTANTQMIASIQQAREAGKSVDEIVEAMRAKGYNPDDYAEYLK